MPESKEHDCIDPTLLSQDLIRHVKRRFVNKSPRNFTPSIWSSPLLALVIDPEIEGLTTTPPVTDRKNSVVHILELSVAVVADFKPLPKLTSPSLSCGLNSSRSRTAARAIIQCLEDSIADTLKIQLLSELLTAMDTSYRSRRSQDPETGRRKRTRALVDEVGLTFRVICQCRL